MFLVPSGRSVAFVRAKLSPLAREFWVLVIVVGALSGLVAAAFVTVLRWTTDLLGPANFTRPEHLFVLAGVGLMIGLISLVLGKPGDVELLVDNIHVGHKSDVRDLRALVPVAILGIAAGSAIGPEAPLVQSTGSLGNWVAHRFGISTIEARALTITGMAAGFTALFGAPLGSAIFALEILHRRGLQYYEAILPAAAGALTGYAVYESVQGLGWAPIWHFPDVPTIQSRDLLIGVGAGVVGGLVAMAFTRATKLFRGVFARVPVAARPVLGGIALGALAFASPYALTFGEVQIGHIVAVKVATATLLLAALAKFLASSIIVSSGWRGGFIIPLFFIGVALGTAVAPSLGISPVVAAAALMAAINVGVTKTPLGSTIVVAEMAGLRLLPPVLIASLVALFLTSRTSMIETQRARDIESPPAIA